MSRILLDTSAYSAVRRRDERLLPNLQEAEQIALNFKRVPQVLVGYFEPRP